MFPSKETPRYKEYLAQRYQVILSYTGLICAIAGIVILFPLLALFAYPEEISMAWGFLLPGGILVLGGLLLWQQLAPKEVESLTMQEGAIIVVLTWLVAIAFGTIPFMTVGGLNFTQAVFESTSSWTTTGLSVVDVKSATHLILLFRATLALAGGAGLAIITLSAIAGPSGSGLTSAEGRSEQIVPNVTRSAKLVLSIYAGYVVFGIIALWLVGMGWFDAIEHSFSALSTAGFSTQPESIGYWDSPAIEAVIVVLMILGSLNFGTSYLLLTGQFKAVLKNGEIKLQTLIIAACASLVFFEISSKIYPHLDKAIRVAIFETVSALSTAGFSTVTYNNWNSLGWLLLIFLMSVGGGTGSSAGGIKLFRIYVLLKALLWEIKQMLLPPNTVTEVSVWQGESRRYLNDAQIRAIGLFAFLHLLCLFIGAAIIAAYGYSLQESIFEYASVLGTAGISVGVTTANAPPGLLWTEIIGMFLVRLEFFTVFVGTIRIFKDIRLIVFDF